MFPSALFSLAASAAAVMPAPCDAATKAEVEATLGGVAVDVPASELGEATAPYCLWATAGRVKEIRVTVWSKEELPVVDAADAAAYFAKLEADASAGGAVSAVAKLGDKAFATAVDGYATVVVLKGERLLVIDFTGIASDDAQAFAARVVGRI